MSELSIEEKIQLMVIAKGLVLGNGGVSAMETKPSEFKAMYYMLRELTLEGTGTITPDSFSYAVADHRDGTADLTVFEGDTGATVELSRGTLNQLIELLAGCVFRDDDLKAAALQLKKHLRPLFDKEADLERFCNLAAVFLAE